MSARTEDRQVSPGPMDSFTARARQRRRTRTLRLAGVAAATLVLAWGLLAAPWAKVREVGVVGAGDQQAAVAAIAAPLKGRPILWQRWSEVERSILDQALIRRVTHETSWKGIVIITAEPRVAMVAVKSGSQWRLIDVDGVQVGQTSTTPQLPVVDLPSGAAGREALKAVIAVLPHVPEDLTIDTIVANGPYGIDIRTKDGVTIRWGGQENSPRKAEVLAGLRKTKAKLYDVTSPETPSIQSGKP